jgi:hypothetical protein
MLLHILSNVRDLHLRRPPTDWKSLALAIAISITSLPSSAKDQIRSTTRDWVKAFEISSPDFKPDSEFLDCLSGKIIDSHCDEYVRDIITMYLNRRPVDERERWSKEKNRLLDQRDQENTNMELAMRDVDVVFGLVQLGLYIFDDRPPPIDANYITTVMENKNTSVEVKSLFNDYLGRKKQGEKFTSKADSEKLIGLANKHLESANSLKAQITKNETFKTQISALYSQAASSLGMAKQILVKKGRQ